MNTDTHGSNEEEWIGFDLDGTLAKYDGWKGVEHIGEPVTTMVVVAKLLHWLGKKIKILTARVAPREDGDCGDKAKKYIEKWCEKNLGFVPEITHLKDASMAALFDDRAVAVEQNTGKVLGGWPDFLPKATEEAKKAVLNGTKWKTKTLAVKKRRDPDGIESEKKANDIESMARVHYPDEGSHGWNHIQDVIASARRMRRRELLKKELAAIMYHDSSLMTGQRETHAEDSAEIAKKELRGIFSTSQLRDIVNAIAHHRASYKGSRVSKLEDLVASADRPVPDLAKQVIRSWKYHEELGEPESERAKNVADHLREKYGLRGYAYANAPKLYLKTYGDELDKAKELFEGLTPDKVRTVVAGSEKKADARPSKEDLLRMYDIMQADARLGSKLKGLGFGDGGDAYRRAAIKMRVMELAKVLQDGKKIRNRIAHTPGYVPSEQDAQRALRQYADADRLLAQATKSAEIKIKDGNYVDVKKIYDSLTKDEKHFVTPGRTVYKDLPRNLVSRSVAYDGKTPVGFADIFGMYPHGSAAFETAVKDGFRGKGLSGRLAEDALRKVFDRIRENRNRKPEDRERLAEIKNFGWDVVSGNDSSARVAQKLGFREKFFHPRGYRSFVMSASDAERKYGGK